jgi:voltage-gated potassium channel
MLIQLVLAFLVIVTVLVHLTGLAVVLRVLRSHSRMFGMVHVIPFTLLVTAAIGIFAIHTIEIWIYAALYLALGAFHTFEAALYF